MNKIPKKVNNIIRIPSDLSTTFFKYWFLFLYPFHHLTNKEMEVITCFLKHRFELSKFISDNDILDSVTMSEDTRKKVIEECGISLPHFQVILGKLRKNKVIIDGRINPKYIPNIDNNSDNFQLLLYFDFKDDKK